VANALPTEAAGAAMKQAARKGVRVQVANAELTEAAGAVLSQAARI